MSGEPFTVTSANGRGETDPLTSSEFVTQAVLDGILYGNTYVQRNDNGLTLLSPRRAGDIRRSVARGRAMRSHFTREIARMFRVPLSVLQPTPWKPAHADRYNHKKRARRNL